MQLPILRRMGATTNAMRRRAADSPNYRDGEFRAHEPAQAVATAEAEGPVSLPMTMVREFGHGRPRGTVPLVTSVYNAATPNTLRVDYAPSGTTTWKSICTGLSSPYTCSWDTTKLAAGDYDLRSVLTAGSTTTTSAIVEAVTVFCPRRPGETAPTFACERLAPGAFRIVCAVDDDASTLELSAATEGPLRSPQPVRLNV